MIRQERIGEARRGGRIQLAAICAALIVVVGACGSAPVEAPTASPSGTAPSGTAPAETAVPSSEPTTSPTEAPTGTAGPTDSPAPTPEPTLSPTLSPTATPRPTPPPTPAPTPSASRLVIHGSRTRGTIALTFDMGGRVGDALAIMDWLVDHGTHATIFMTGAMAASTNTDAGRVVLGTIDAHPALFTLGNHSYSHPDFRTLSAAQMRSELLRTEAALATYCAQDPRPLFRPPFGGYDSDVLAGVGAVGYRDTILWDVDTIDWRPIANDPPGPTADQIVAKVLANAQGGSIVLMHLGGYETFAALPRIVEGLEAHGYGFVTLDEMLGT